MQLTVKGLYRFFNLSMHEITNRLFTFDDLFGAWGAQLQERLANIEDLQEKIASIQSTLVDLLNRNIRDYSLLDHTIDVMNAAHGIVRVNDLVKQTGYSKRYLDMLFKQRVGVSPKLLASITRFQLFYRLWAQGKSEAFLRDSLYSYYYDQSHFIRDFRRFTGYAPREFTQIGNEFGRLFYTREAGSIATP